jgi:hypothetical protein
MALTALVWLLVAGALALGLLALLVNGVLWLLVAASDLSERLWPRERG